MSENPVSENENQVKPLAAKNNTKMQGESRKAARYQFPRRLILLLIAFVFALIVITLLSSALVNNVGSQGGNGIPEIIERADFPELLTVILPKSLPLLGASLFVAFILSVIAVAAAVGIHQLEQGAGWPGSILKVVGRLFIIGTAALPALILGMLLIGIFALQLKWLPPMGLFSIAQGPSLGSRLTHLILPTLTMSLLPALLASQSTARWLTLPRDGRFTPRRILAGLTWLGSALLGQIGGVLSALVIVETIFNLPGIGRMFTQTFVTFNFPAILGCLYIYAGFILIGRILSELLLWVTLQLDSPSPDAAQSPAPGRTRQTARKIWLVIGMVFLLLALVVFFSGVTVSAEETAFIDAQHTNEEPSDLYPWGTDSLGRDLKTRVMSGAANDLSMAGLTTILLLVPAALGGVLSSYLNSKGTLLQESLADLVLFPADILLFIPALPGAIALALLLFSKEAGTTVLICALVLLPRVVRVFPLLWKPIFPMKKGPVILAAAGAVLLSSLFAAFLLIISMNFLGLGVQPPTASLGLIISEIIRSMSGTWSSTLRVLLLGYLCSLSLYMAADAVIGIFASKDIMARLNT